MWPFPRHTSVPRQGEVSLALGTVRLSFRADCGDLRRPFYHKGMAVCSGFVFFVALLALVLRM